MGFLLPKGHISALMLYLADHQAKTYDNVYSRTEKELFEFIKIPVILVPTIIGLIMIIALIITSYNAAVDILYKLFI